MARKSLDHLGQLQAAVMEVVWRLGQATVQQVRQELPSGQGLAYTTVLSVMQKLEKAGWLTHRADGRSYLYLPKRSRREAGQSALSQFIDRTFGGDALVMMQHLLEDERLSELELTELRKMIERRRKELHL